MALVGATTVAAERLGAASDMSRWLDAMGNTGGSIFLGVVLGGSLALAIAAWRWHRSGQAAGRELARLARLDPLTELPNRSAEPAAVAAIVRSTRDGMHLAAALFCDLDRFKQVNDSYGHEVGDILMRAVADRLREAVGRQGKVIRHGGDEFVVLAGALGSAGEAAALGRSIVTAVETPFELGPDTVRISVSVGVAICDRGGCGAEDLLVDADVAMYAAKADGPGSVRMFEPAMRARLSRATAAQQLRSAIDNGELTVRYVPIHAVSDGSLVSVRAELSWDGPMRTPVAGRELAAALDDTGLVIEAGNLALHAVTQQVARWSATAVGRDPVQVVLPVSPRQLAQAGFRDRVAAELAESGIEPRLLCFVVSGRAVGNEITDAWGMLRHLRTLGVAIALEGFGAGVSSLADLRTARLDHLWIHRDLVSGMVPGSEDSAIVEHIVGLAHQMGIVVVADGVDAATQHTLLRAMSCDRASGTFFGGEMTGDAVSALLPPRIAAYTGAAIPRLRVVG